MPRCCAACELFPWTVPRSRTKDEVPEMEQMVQQALRARSDLAIQIANELNSQISALGTANGLLPTLVAFGGTQNSGLAGTARFVSAGPGRPPVGPGSVLYRRSRRCAGPDLPA